MLIKQFAEKKIYMQYEKNWNNGINIIQISIGLISLFIGGIVYIIARSPNQTYFISKYLSNIYLFNSVPSALRIIGNNLPEFIHPFSFILITAGVMAFKNKRSYVFICLGWFLLNSIFEFGQKFSQMSLKLIPDWFEGIPFLENSRNYFLYGTFDILDLIAILLGSIAAYYVLLLTSARRERK